MPISDDNDDEIYQLPEHNLKILLDHVCGRLLRLIYHGVGPSSLFDPHPNIMSKCHKKILETK